MEGQAVGNGTFDNIFVDDIRVRLPMVTGQINTAKLHVIAIADANNSLMNMVVYLDGNRAKQLMGYKPWESASLQLTLKNPQVTARKYADILYPKLKPQPISLVGKIGHGASSGYCSLNMWRLAKKFKSTAALISFFLILVFRYRADVLYSTP
jgi:hypothetical protein